MTPGKTKEELWLIGEQTTASMRPRRDAGENSPCEKSFGLRHLRLGLRALPCQGLVLPEAQCIFTSHKTKILIVKELIVASAPWANGYHRSARSDTA